MMKKNTKSTKPSRNYIKLAEALGQQTDSMSGQLWLRSSKQGYESVGMSVDIDGGTLSDFVRCIELRDVVLQVEENEGGYPTLVICGHE